MPIERPTGRTPPAKDAGRRSRSRRCRRSPRALRWRRIRSPAPRPSGTHRDRPAVQQPRGPRRWRCGCRCPAAGAVHAARWNRPGRSTRVTCCAAVSTLSSRARWGKPPADGRPNSPGVRQLLAHAQQLIRENFPRAAGPESRQSPPPRLYQLVLGQAGSWSGVWAAGHAERPGEAGWDEHIAGNQVVDRCATKTHQRRVDAVAQDVEHILNAGLSVSRQPP